MFEVTKAYKMLGNCLILSYVISDLIKYLSIEYCGN